MSPGALAGLNAEPYEGGAMSQVVVDISVSLDGYVAGPDQTMEEPLGRGGEQLHEWAVALESWRASHGRGGGERNADDDIMRARIEGNGATIMGRRMYSGGAGPWESDPNPGGWWGDEPPFRHPVFVLTHHAREPREMRGGTTFTFVTDGIEAALEQARSAAGDKDVAVAGGAETARQYLDAGLVDELHLHVAPVLLGGGARLLDGTPGALECTGVVASPAGVAHLRYRPRR
jgi:dihydrofolate reductase